MSSLRKLLGGGLPRVAVWSRAAAFLLGCALCGGVEAREMRPDQQGATANDRQSGPGVRHTVPAEPRVAASFYPSRQRSSFNEAPQTPHPSVARISVAESGATSHGTATLVGLRGDYALLVTNWHVVRDAHGPIVAVFPDGSRSAATVVKVDRDWDLAALLIWRAKARPVPISRRAPQPGDLLTIAGYGPGNFRAALGRCTQYVAPGPNMPYEMVEVSAEARQGDSGGPIFNEHGELAGVLFGAAGGTTSGSYCGRVRLFLESVWPAIDHVDEPPRDVMVSVPAHARPRTRAEPSEEATPQFAVRALPDRARPLYDAPDRGASRIPVTLDRIERSPDKTQIDWNDIVGSTPTDQAKTILAGIGILAILVQLTRSLSGKSH